MFKRDRSITFPLEKATWVAADGIRYLRPELVLAHKLRRTRTVDDHDLDSTLPLLDADAVAFLLDLVERSDPSHHWRSPLEDASRAKEEHKGRRSAPRTLFGETDLSAHETAGPSIRITSGCPGAAWSIAAALPRLIATDMFP